MLNCLEFVKCGGNVWVESALLLELPMRLECSPPPDICSGRTVAIRHTGSRRYALTNFI